jgi:hypothetical protein
MYDGYKNDIQYEFISHEETMRKTEDPYPTKKNLEVPTKSSSVDPPRA